MNKQQLSWFPTIALLLLLLSTGCYTQLKLVNPSARSYRAYTNRAEPSEEYTRVRSDTDTTENQVIINNYYLDDYDWCDWADCYYPSYRFSLGFTWGYYDPFFYPFWWPPYYFSYYRPSGFLYSPFVVLYPVHFFSHSFHHGHLRFGKRPFDRRLPVGSRGTVVRNGRQGSGLAGNRVVVRRSSKDAKKLANRTSKSARHVAKTSLAKVRGAPPLPRGRKVVHASSHHVHRYSRAIRWQRRARVSSPALRNHHKGRGWRHAFHRGYSHHFSSRGFGHIGSRRSFGGNFRSSNSWHGGMRHRGR